MKRNTLTVFGELRQGDRFRFAGDRSRKAYQITVEKIIHRSMYNIVSEEGKKEWPFDRQSGMDRAVIFMRHTILQADDECMLYDLQMGDTFFFTDNVVTEYAVVNTDGYNPKKKYLVDAINAETQTFSWSDNLPVIYVGKSEITSLQKQLVDQTFFNH